MGFRVWSLRFRVWDLGLGVWGLGFEVWGLGFPHQDMRRVPRSRGGRGKRLTPAAASRTHARIRGYIRRPINIRDGTCIRGRIGIRRLDVDADALRLWCLVHRGLERSRVYAACRVQGVGFRV